MSSVVPITLGSGAQKAPGKKQTNLKRGQRGDSTTGTDQKKEDVRISNINAAKAVADTVRSSLGPRGMDKMIIDEKGDVLITNDGATILKHIEALHPCAKMVWQLFSFFLSKFQKFTNNYFNHKKKKKSL